MSPNEQKWVNWLIAQENSGTLIDFDAAQAKLNAPAPAPSPSGADTPDANDLVGLIALPATWNGWRHNICEINLASTGDQKSRGLANLSHANGEYNIALQFIGTAYLSTPSGAGLPYNLDTDKPIPNTVSWPNGMSPDGTCDLSTVAGVTAWCQKLGKPPGPNAGATPFPTPPGK